MKTKAEKIGEMAKNALLEEVYTTPKPGLVDLWTSGAHRDMNVHTMEKSADSLFPFFVSMAEQGMSLLCPPPELFIMIRKTGISAEQAMYQATGGVNTHKGMIFTLGIFCAAAGRCIQKNKVILSEKQLIQTQKEMTSDILQKELSRITEVDYPEKSNGEKNLKRYGTQGIRGEALRGYPSVIEIALPEIRRGICCKKEWNRIKLQTLFALMSSTEDSNILARHNRSTLYTVQKEAVEFLKDGGAYGQNYLEKLIQMDQDYTRKRISAGGCADLLAAGIFLFSLLDKRRW